MRRTATQSLLRSNSSKSPCKVVFQIVLLNENRKKITYIFFLKHPSIKFHTKFISVVLECLYQLRYTAS